MNKVTSQTQGLTKINSFQASGILQRKCACGNHTVAGGECDECRARRSELQRTKSSPFIDQQAMQSAVDPLTGGLIESRFGFDFSRVSVRGERGPSTLQGPWTDEKQPTPREFEAQGIAGLSSNEAQIDVDVKVIRPPASSRLAAALSMAGEEVEGDDEVILTAQTPGGPIAPGPMVPPGPSCTYAITYANVQTPACTGGRCGAAMVYDATEVWASGSGCPDLDGLPLTEVVTNDHGCVAIDVVGGGGCTIESHPPMLPTYGLVRQPCTDTYAMCAPAAVYPAAGCTETVTQKLSVGGVLAETRTIKFRITKSGGSCSGTATRT